MDDSHESLPAPEKTPTNIGKEASPVPQNQHATEAEQVAARTIENPAFGLTKQHQATQSTATDTNSTSVAQPMAGPQSGDNQQVQANATTSTPQIADDVDLIEKEWVHKIKDTVNNTKDDPHSQNSQIAHLRADYMKKRYNKDIKLLKE